MARKTKIWFITGISRGLGRELAKAALGQADVVIGTTRDGTSDLACGAGELYVLPLELPDARQVERVVRQAYALHRHLDVVVNNAGYGLLGAIEETSNDQVQHLFDVNFFGPLQVIRAVLPLLRQQLSGHIINLSSIAGLAPAPGSGLYAATKFALEGMSQSLAQEVAPLGIKVTVVEPGAFRTDFLSQHSLRKADGHIDDYAHTAGARTDHLSRIAGHQLGDPALAAKAILEIVRTPEPPLHLLLGSDALRRTREQQMELAAEIDQWESLSRSTDSPDGAA